MAELGGKLVGRRGLGKETLVYTYKGLAFHTYWPISQNLHDTDPRLKSSFASHTYGAVFLYLHDPDFCSIAFFGQ